MDEIRELLQLAKHIYRLDYKKHSIIRLQKHKDTKSNGGITMKVQSDHIPESLVKSRGKTQVNYNIEEITVEDMDNEPRTAYEYDMVVIEGEVTRDKIISTILTAGHSINEQIAILFNERAGRDIAEYNVYQTKRVDVKAIADHIIHPTKEIKK